MQSKEKYIFWGKAILFALLLVFLVRTFWIESYVISSSEMEDSLQEGDRLIVDKDAYGLRLPLTLLTLPFTYDNILGRKSYSSLIELPYKRIGRSPVPLNDVVVYNHPLQTELPLDKRALCIGRCVARAGDTVRINGYDLHVNGRHYQTSPDYLIEYSIPSHWGDSVRSIMRQLNIPEKKIVGTTGKWLLSLNKLEAYLMKAYLPDSLWRNNKDNHPVSYEVIVPRKGMKIRLDKQNTNVYAYLICQEIGKDATLRNGVLFVKGKIPSEYVFTDDYYWLMPDNQKKGVGSRHLGFVSEKNIIGKAVYIWFSHSHRGIVWDRVFTSVK